MTQEPYYTAKGTQVYPMFLNSGMIPGTIHAYISLGGKNSEPIDCIDINRSDCDTKNMALVEIIARRRIAKITAF